MPEKQNNVYYETYDTIYASQGKKALESIYNTRESIATRFIVRQEPRNKFLVFRDWKDFYKFQSSLPQERRNFHETIFGWMRQKLKFDLDYSGTADDTDQVSLDLDEILDAISAVFYTHYGIDVSNKIIVFDSSGPDGDGGYKYSYHIVIDGYYVTSNIEADAFANFVVENLSPSACKMIDRNVYKNLQFMRLYGNCKFGSGRVKLIYGDNDIDNDMIPASIITNTMGCVELDSIASNEHETDYSSRELLDDDTKTVLEIVKGHTRGHKYRRTVGSRIEFQRLTPTHCDFCNEVHHNDNTLVFDLAYSNITRSYAILMKCRHAPGKYSYVGDYAIIDNGDGDGSSDGGSDSSTDNPANKGDILPALILAKELQQEEKETDDVYPVGFIKSQFDQLEDTHKNVYSDKKLNPFEVVPTLCVRAQMKMGKTKTLEKYIDDNFNTEIVPTRAVFISFRQTFSSEIKAKFPDFTLYSDVEGTLKHPKVIVQVESLHRLYVNTPVDLVVLDESESIFEQFGSGLLKHHGKSWATFQWLLRHSKHVVAMDANLGDRSYTMLKSMRPQHPLFYHCNVHQNDIGSKYHFTAIKEEWLYMLYHTLDNNERVVIPASSLREAETIHKTINERYPEKRIGLYTSKTSMTEKRRHFSDVNMYWSAYDVLIYTPTVSAGVSFEVAHYDKMFCYFIDKSCTVETCHQMMGRIRNVKSRNYYLCINSTFNNLPTAAADIKRFMLNKRANLMRNFDDTFIHYEYDADGALNMREDDYLTLWIENQRVANLSRNKFASRFINYLRGYGGEIITLNIAELTGDDPEKIAIDVDAICKTHKANKSSIVEEEALFIASSRDITPDEADDIREHLSNLNGDNNAVEDMLIETRYEYEKYKLRESYNWKGGVTVDFVRTYHEPHTRQMYINLRQICSGANCWEALLNIKKRERETLKVLMNSEESQYANVQRRFVFDKHRCAIVMLASCGFEDLFDRKTVSKVRMHQNLQKRHDDIVKFQDIIANDMGLYVPNLHIKHLPTGQYVHKMTNFINRVLNHMYGFSIIGGHDIYSIRKSSKFEYLHEGDEDLVIAEEIELTKPIVHVYCSPRDHEDNDIEYIGFDDEDYIGLDEIKIDDAINALLEEI